MKQSGQSMTEFALGSAVLGLLLLGTLAIGGYQEVDRRVALAARQSVWMHSWAPGGASSGVHAQELHGDLLADVGAYRPTGKALLVTEEDFSLQSGVSAPAGVAGAAAQVMLAPLQVAGGFLGSGFDLTEGGLVAGGAIARIAPLADLPEPFDSLDLQLRAPFALLGDAWHAGGVSHVRQRAGGLVPGSSLAGLNEIWRPLSLPLSIVEPSLAQLCLGIIEPDRVPEDRLGPGRTPLPGGCP